MPYLAPHFAPDVFVSYSHGAPSGGLAPLRDWSRDLVERLKAGIRSLKIEFEGLEVWMDPDIDPTALLTNDLRAKASGCGVLMIVMSERYLKSRWCQDELEWFKTQIQDRAGPDGRVFVIRAQDTETSLWPEFLRDDRGHAMKGFPFYDPVTGEPRGFQQLQPSDDEYFKELGRLRLWLTTRLRELRDRAAADARMSAGAGAQPSSSPMGPRLVYLHAPPGGESEREEVRGVLAGEGIEPITAPTRSVGGGLADWRRESNERINLARNCEALTILRVGDPGRFANDLLGIGVQERQEMVGPRGTPPPCAVFDRTDEVLPIDARRFGIARFDINRSDWRSQFRAWLDASRAAPAGAAL